MPVIRTILFGPFAIASPIKTGGANARIEKHFHKQRAQSTFIEPGSSVQGYFFYNMPNRPTNVNGWEVDFNLRDSTANTYRIAYIFGEGAKIENISPSISYKTDTKIYRVEISVYEELKKLKKIYNEGLITKQDYEKKKQELLKKI